MKSYLMPRRLLNFHAPAGMILPITTGDYVIPVTAGSGAVGKALDIRPPAQPCHVSERRVPSSFMIPLRYWWKMVVAASLRPQVVSVIQAKNYPIENDDAARPYQSIGRELNRLDEDGTVS